MTWTYDNNADSGANATANQLRDAVRLLIGDTDSDDQQVTDEEIAFALDEEDNNVYSAALIMVNAIIGKYSRLTMLKFSDVSVDYSKRIENYKQLRQQLRDQASRTASSLGTPKAGGIRDSEMESAEEDTDRVRPAFRRGQFRNPDEEVEDDILDYRD